MTDVTSPPPRPVRLHGRQTPGSESRWWWGVFAAAIVALPLSWLLSYAAALPFFLGLFFFMLFGLVIGAAAFRVAAPKRPYSAAAVITGTTLLVGLTWGLSMLKESRDFPDDIAQRIALGTRDLGGRSLKEFRKAAAADVRAFLAGRYPPGGMLGYLRWTLTSGEIKRGDLPVFDRAVVIPASRKKGWWAARVIGSIALLAFGIGSQTLSLARRGADRGGRGHPKNPVD